MMHEQKVCGEWSLQMVLCESLWHIMTDWFAQRTYRITRSQQGNQSGEGKTHEMGHSMKNHSQSKLMTVRMINVVNFTSQRY